MKTAPIGGGTRKNWARTLVTGSLPELTMTIAAVAIETRAGAQTARLRTSLGSPAMSSRMFAGRYAPRNADPIPAGVGASAVDCERLGRSWAFGRVRTDPSV